VRLPDGVSDREGALVEPLAVGLHAISQGRLRPGETVVIVGFGMIGCAAALMARAAGAARVVVSEPRRDRARLASALGATEVLEDGLDATRKRLRADLVVECSGRPELAQPALELSRRGGRLVLAGIAHTPATLDLSRIVYFEREVIGALGYRFDLERVVRLMEAGAVDVRPLLSDPIRLDDIVEGAFERSLNDAEAPPRIFVAPT
jgi:(R,R)-butanediol dehydrogenase/meso-butanediol dehydrogenase/diacetyl reductase